MQYISESIVEWLIKWKMVLREDKELYEYAVYSFILSILPMLIVMIMGMIMGRFTESIVMIIPFMFIRKFSGGIHVKYLLVCVVISCSILFFCVYMIRYINYGIGLNIITICSIISLMILSPVDSKNRQLDGSEKIKYKKIARIWTGIFGSIYFLLLFWNNKTYAVCVAEGIVLTAVLQMLCLLERADKIKK